MIGFAIDDARQAGAAYALLTGHLNIDTVLGQCLDDRDSGRNANDLAAAGKLDVEGLIAAGSKRCATKILKVQLRCRPTTLLGRLHDMVDETARTTDVEMRMRIRRSKQLRQVQLLRVVATVKVVADAIGKSRSSDTLAKGRALRAACAIVHGKLDATGRKLFGHTQQGRHSDAAGQQQRAFGGRERKVIFRRTDVQ